MPAGRRIKAGAPISELKEGSRAMIAAPPPAVRALD